MTHSSRRCPSSLRILQLQTKEPNNLPPIDDTCVLRETLDSSEEYSH